MRRAYNDVQLVESDGKFIGVSLGYDHCAEHEWGINGINRDFGIQGKPTRDCLGYDCRKTTKFVFENMLHFECGGVETLAYQRWWHKPVKAPSELELYKGEQIAAAWDEGSFGVALRDNRKLLDELLKAFVDTNVLVFTAGRCNPFGGSGLSLLIADRVPSQHWEDARQADTDTLDLQDASAATGIIHKLDSVDSDEKRWHGKRCGYYACSPAWASDKKNTKYNVVYWLNPVDQKNNNHGWFTVEELEQWIDGTGPVPKGK